MTVATTERPVTQPKRKVKVRCVNGIHHVKVPNQCYKGEPGKENAVTSMRQCEPGEILEVDADSKEARDSDPTSKYYTGKFQRVFDEEIGQRGDETPLEAAQRLRALADKIEKDLNSATCEPTPSQSEIEAAQALLARAGVTNNMAQPPINQVPNALPSDNPIQQAAQAGFSQKKPTIDFSKMSVKELQEYCAAEEISITGKTKHAEIVAEINKVARK